MSSAAPTPHSFKATISGPTFPCEEASRQFRSEHAEWFVQLGSPDLLYCLPEEAIGVLERPGVNGGAILDPTSASAERKLLEICRKANAIGFWLYRPVIYLHLSPRLPRSSLERLLQGFPEAERRPYLDFVRIVDEAEPRRAGVAGWLCTELDYLDGIRHLTSLWNELPEAERPSFPLGRPLSLPMNPKDDRPASLATQGFAEELQTFLDQWELMYLVTWDLPAPQGPLLPNPLPAGSPAVPVQGIHYVLPTHSPLQGGDDLVRGIRQQQEALAKVKGLDRSIASLPHYEAYAQILQVIHLERIMCQRYRRHQKGFMTHVECALAAALHCGIDNIKKFRKAISLCLRGKRAEVTWLRPRAR